MNGAVAEPAASNTAVRIQIRRLVRQVLRSRNQPSSARRKHIVFSWPAQMIGPRFVAVANSDGPR